MPTPNKSLPVPEAARLLGWATKKEFAYNMKPGTWWGVHLLWVCVGSCAHFKESTSASPISTFLVSRGSQFSGTFTHLPQVVLSMNITPHMAPLFFVYLYSPILLPNLSIPFRHPLTCLMEIKGEKSPPPSMHWCSHMCIHEHRSHCSVWAVTFWPKWYCAMHSILHCTHCHLCGKMPSMVPAT